MINAKNSAKTLKVKQLKQSDICIYNLQNFTVENGVYKGQVKHFSKYRSLGEMIWISLKNHRDNVAHVSQYLHVTLKYVRFKKINFLKFIINI